MLSAVGFPVASGVVSGGASWGCRRAARGRKKWQDAVGFCAFPPGRGIFNQLPGIGNNALLFVVIFTIVVFWSLCVFHHHAGISVLVGSGRSGTGTNRSTQRSSAWNIFYWH